MEKKRKYTRSSEKGIIGNIWYNVDARVFNSAEQRERVKRNLETKEGCVRLLKNSNPVYWMLVLGEVEETKGGGHGDMHSLILEDNPELVKALKHRIVHLLRLDGKKYYEQKLFAAYILSRYELYHPRFLKDYIEFYENTASCLEGCDPLKGDKFHPEFNELEYFEIEEGSIYTLKVIIKILENWDRHYEYPGYLHDFIDRAAGKIAPDQSLFESKSYSDRIFKREHLLRTIVYHDSRKDRITEGFPLFEERIASLDLKALSEDFQFFTNCVVSPEKNSEEAAGSIEEFEALKESLFRRLYICHTVSSYFALSYKLQHPLYIKIYDHYNEQFRVIEDFLEPIKHPHLRDENTISLLWWNMDESYKDNLLYRLIFSLKEPEIWHPLYEIGEEKEKQRLMEENIKTIEKLMNSSYEDDYSPFKLKNGDIDDYLDGKYWFTENYELNRELHYRYCLKVPDRVQISQTLLEGFHELEEKEQTRRLELLYLSGGTVPDDAYYTTDYQFYLMFLTISLHWKEERFLPVFKKQLSSGDERRIVPSLLLAEESPIACSRELLVILYQFWSMEHAPKVRLALIKAIIDCSDNIDRSWWTEERKELLRSWIRAEEEEEEEEVLKEVRRFWRYLKKGSYSR